MNAYREPPRASLTIAQAPPVAWWRLLRRHVRGRAVRANLVAARAKRAALAAWRQRLEAVAARHLVTVEQLEAAVERVSAAPQAYQPLAIAMMVEDLLSGTK